MFLRRSSLEREKISLVCITVFELFLFVTSVAFAASDNGSKDGFGEEQKTAIHFNEARESESDSNRSAGSRHIVVASWYGSQFQGKLMANGSPFNMNNLTVAHKSLPLGTRVRIQNVENGREIIATVTDRGPYVKGRGIDLSRQAAKLLGIFQKGTGRVKILTM
jgi:rare lipoprotein A (peptidoglycan hydrolase)